MKAPLAIQLNETLHLTWWVSFYFPLLHVIPGSALVLLAPLPLFMHLTKHRNYLHMTNHTLVRFNLGLTLASKWVGLNSLQTSQVVQGFVVWDYHLSPSCLIENLCSVWRFSMSRTFPQALFPQTFTHQHLCNLWECCQMENRTQPNT